MLLICFFLNLYCRIFQKLYQEENDISIHLILKSLKKITYARLKRIFSRRVLNFPKLQNKFIEVLSELQTIFRKISMSLQKELQETSNRKLFEVGFSLFPKNS